jgi:hypothetical protein
MRVLKAVSPEGSVLTFDIPDHASEVTIGNYFECHIAYHAFMQALRAEADGKALGMPIGAYLNALAFSLRPFTKGQDPLKMVLQGDNEQDIATMLMGAVEGIASCMATYEAVAPANTFEWGGETWHLCQQAVNYREKRGPGFSVEQVAQSLLLEEYYNNFIEFKLAKEVERVIEERAAINASELYVTPTRIFLAQMALFLRKSADEALPTSQEAFDHWHAERIKEVEHMPLSVALDIRNFFFSYINALAEDPIFRNWFKPPRAPTFKESPDQIRVRNWRERHEDGKGRHLSIYGRLWKTGAWQTWRVMLDAPFFDAIQIAIATEYP